MKHHTIHEQDQALPAVDLGEAIGAFVNVWQRRWKFIMSFVVMGVLMAATYAVFAETKYTAWASIIIDPRADKSPDGPETAPLVMTADALIVDSEVKVLKSRDVTTRAVESLNLVETTEAEGDGLLTTAADWVRNALGQGAQQTVPLDSELYNQILTEDVRREFVKHLEIERSGETYVIDVSYTAPDPVAAANNVNAVVEAYLDASSDRRSADFGRLNEWLGTRLSQLEDEVRKSETAIADYRRANQIYELNDGLLPSEVELSAATQTLIDMRNGIVALSVKIEKLTAQIEAGQADAVSLSPEDRTIALEAFEARYTELLQAEISTIQQRGENSRVVDELRISQEQVRGLILGELRKIRERLITRYETLERRIVETKGVVDELRIAANKDAEALIELRRLERQSESKQRIFEELLASYNNSAELRSFEGSPARVIAWAVPPNEKSAPRSKLLVVLGGFGAFVVGLSLAFMRDSMDGSLRRSEDLSEMTGFRFLGVVPTVRSEKRRMRSMGLKSSTTSAPQLPADLKDLRFAADYPKSIMADTLHALQIQLDWASSVDPVTRQRKTDRRGVVAGFVSSVTGEGKTTVATNFATLLAQQSSRVALLDLDLRKNELSRKVGPMLPNENSLGSLILDQDVSRLSVSLEFEGLTIVKNDGGDSLSLAISDDADELGQLLDMLRDHFDYVIVDAPPIQGLADSTVLGRLCDKLVFVVHWGITQPTELQLALKQLRGLGDRIVGTIFSRAELDSYLKYNRETVKGIYY